MKKHDIEYDDHGNFVIDGDLEVQWMKLHRDIQTEYRMEKLVAFLKGTALVGITLSAGYLLLNGLNQFV